MNYSIVILPSAKDDLRESGIWYNNVKMGLGKKMIEKIQKTLFVIKDNPFLYQIRYKDIRTATVKQFPFLIHYTVNQKNKTVVVLSILHTSRNPRIWKNRIK
jgi:mRNA-degrading endonuclease RelE of RelBE toxin-antitoxin system